MLADSGMVQIGERGVFTKALLRNAKDTIVIKPISGTFTPAEIVKLKNSHDCFVARIRGFGIKVPKTEVVMGRQRAFGHDIWIEQTKFNPAELATNIVELKRTDLALKAAQLVFLEALKVVRSSGEQFNGFHGTLRNFAIKQIDSSSPEIYFIDTFPPFNSPRELLAHLANFGQSKRLQFVASLAEMTVPEKYLRHHSIFNPYKMLAGIIHSTARRRPEILAAFSLWAHQQVEDLPPVIKDPFREKLAQGFDFDPPYRKAFRFLTK